MAESKDYSLEIGYLLETGEFADAILFVYPDENGNRGDPDAAPFEIKVHRCILSARSPAFAKMLLIQRQTAEDVIIVKGLSRKAVQVMLTFIYTGKINWEWTSVAGELIVAAERYKLDGLAKFLNENISLAVKPQNAIKIRDAAEAAGHEFQKALDTVGTFIQGNMESCLQAFRQMEPQNAMKIQDVADAAGHEFQAALLDTVTFVQRNMESCLQTFKQMSIVPPTCILMHRNPATPYSSGRLTLTSSNYKVTVTGRILHNPDQFAINIIEDDQRLIHVNPRWYQGETVLNSFSRGRGWGQEEFARFRSLTPNSEFQITITHNDGIFWIDVNKEQRVTFRARIGTVGNTREVQVTKVDQEDIQLTSVQMDCF